MNAMSRASWSARVMAINILIWRGVSLDIKFWLAMNIMGRSQQDSSMRGVE